MGKNLSMNSHLLIKLAAGSQCVLCVELARQGGVGQTSHGPEDISRQCYPTTIQPERPKRRNNVVV